MFSAHNWCAFPKNDPKRNETWSWNVLIVNLYVNFVGFVLYVYEQKHEHEWHKIETENINFVNRSFLISH